MVWRWQFELKDGFPAWRLSERKPALSPEIAAGSPA
jgi:hypothetical protein